MAQGKILYNSLKKPFCAKPKEVKMPSDDDLFTGDPLNNSEENRLNHILFGLFLNDNFRESVLERIKMPRDSVIYKPTKRSWDGTPDFAVEGPDGELAAYIEVELDQDPEQLAWYKAKAGVPVHSFGRLSSQGHTITLMKLVELAREAAEASNSAQLELMVRHLAKQVEGNRGHRNPGPVKDQMGTCMGRALSKAGMVNWGDEPVQRGKVFGRTYSAEGISVRVVMTDRRTQTVSVLHQTKGQPGVRFASQEHLTNYLTDRTEQVESWADFIQEELGGDIRGLDDLETCELPLSLVEQHIDRLVEMLWTLA